MTSASFLRGDEVARLIERAVRCAGMPVSVHVPQGDRWVRVAGSGKCAACGFVAGLTGGKAACENSRGTAASAALRSQMGRAFICHAGFACLTVPCTGGGALTFGPYCPAEEPESLATDFIEGLAALGHRGQAPPVSLQDIHHIPASAVPALAAWTVDELAGLWARVQADSQEPEPESEGEVPAAKARRRQPARADSAREAQGLGAIAAALAGGSHDKARALLTAALGETSGSRKATIMVKRCRAVAIAAAVLEAGARAQLPVEACWAQFGTLIDEAQKARTDLQLVNATLKLLGALKRQRRQPAVAQTQSYVELNEIVLEHLASGITLTEVAARLGQQPSAITHRLQRNFGMSFSDYVGRLRVDRAKELLRRTKLTVEAVGRRVGIEDASNFRKLFRKFEPLSPQEYREQFRDKK